MIDMVTYSYSEYLWSTEWLIRRADALAAADYSCQRCGKMHGLDVHHVTYERLGNELPDDLEVLCRGCHAAEHGKKPTYMTF